MIVQTSARDASYARAMLDARIRSAIEAYVAAWAETDASARKVLLERACADDFHMRTPGRAIDGRDALDALITEFQRRYPGARAVLSSVIDVQSTCFRYTGRVEGTPSPLPDALDVGESDESGRIRILLSFVGAALPTRP